MIAIVLGSIALSCLLAQQALRGLRCGAGLRLVVALVIAATLHGLLYLSALLAGCPFGALITAALIANGAALFAVVRRRRRIPQPTGLPAIDAADLAAAGYLLAATYLFTRSSIRWGGWDGWAIWNLHAEFLYWDRSWTNMFSGSIAWSHPDYPLLLPALIAMLWKGSGAVTPVVPVLVAYATLAAVMAVLYLALREGRPGWIGAAGMALAVDGRFIAQAASQYADTLLALFLLLAVVFIQRRRDGAADDVLAGLFAGSAMLVKNEGMAFFAVATAVLAVGAARDPARIGRFLLGAAVPLAATVLFKLRYAPVNDLIGNAGAQGAAVGMAAAAKVARHFATTAAGQLHGVLVLLLAGLLVAPRRLLSPALAAVAISVGVFLAAYLLSPYDLDWHLRASLDRLLHQVSPALAYLGAAALGDAAVASAGGPGGG